MGGIRPWTLLVSAAVHLALLLLVLDWTEDPGAAAVGLGGLEVALGPAGGATTSPVAPEEAPVEEVQPPPPTEAVEVAEAIPPEPPTEPVTAEPPPEPVAVEPTPPEPPRDVPAEVRAAEAPQPAVAEPPPAVEPDTPPLITSSAVDPVETVAAVPQEVRPEPVAAAKPVELQTVEAREPAIRPPPPPKPRREPPRRRQPARVAAPPAPAPQAVAEAAPTSPAPTSSAPAAAAPSADPGPPASTRGTPGAAQGADVDSDPGGGLPGPTPDYLGLLRAWLEKHKEYPRPSRTRREEGTVLLRFVMERSGRVVSHRIERSSGYPALDRAVEEMLARAQPLPAMPPDMLQAKLELVVPVQFALRGQ